MNSIFRRSTKLTIMGCVPLVLTACGGGETTEDVGSSSAAVTVATSSVITPEQQNSQLYQSYQAYLARAALARTLVASGGTSDTLATYAAKCDIATGVHVPSFTCDNGTEVPNQTPTPCTKPNVLNGACDPGSKFQVLPGQTADAVAVAHCRKVGLPTNNTTYNDIAVIQYNKKNGAVCFYQALTNLEGNNVPEPSTDTHFWISPAGTENIKCTGCHTTGGFVRSPYLTQLVTPSGSQNVGNTSHLPNSADGYDNNVTALAFVGSDYATNRTWSVSTARAGSDTGLACTTCHRMGVSNETAFGFVNGSAGHLGIVATDRTQASKVPHSPSSPIWMRPNQIYYGICSNNASKQCNQNSECGTGSCNSGAAASAALFNNCATGFWAGQPENFSSGTPVSGCTFSPLGQTFTGFSPATAVSALSTALL